MKQVSLFANEPHDSALNYMVDIEGSTDREKWVKVAGPMTCNAALDATGVLHEEWRFLRFTRIEDKVN